MALTKTEQKRPQAAKANPAIKRRKLDSGSQTNGKQVKPVATVAWKRQAVTTVNKKEKKEEEEDEEEFDGFTSDDDDRDEPQDKNNHSSLDESNDIQPATSSGKSREAHQKQKAVTASRKAAKPHSDDIGRAKKLWEQLRQKSHLDKSARESLVVELSALTQGRVHDFVFKHDSVRVIECLVKYASPDQRKAIARELKGAYKTMVESRYSKFLVAKIIVEGDQETKDLIIPEFYGHVRRLINHPEASWILDDIYRTVATRAQRARLLREWYGPEFSIAQLAEQVGLGGDSKSKPSADLTAILKHHPEKKPTILKYLGDLINQLVQKKLTGFTILHDAMLQYMTNLSPDADDFKAFHRLVLGDSKEEETDLLRNLAFTESGSELVCLLLAYSTAKDRRQILKAYKDVMEMLAYDKWGHRVLIAALDTLDDTRELLSRIFSELILLGDKFATTEEQIAAQSEKVANFASHKIGHICLLYPFLGAKPKILPPDSLRLMQRVQAIRTGTSKKDASVRCSELIAGLSAPYLGAIASQAAELAAAPNNYGCLFISEVLFDGVGDKSSALESVASLTNGDVTDSSHVFNTPSTGKLFKSLIAGGRFDHASKKIIPVEPKLHFADIVLASLRQSEASGTETIEKWVSSEGAFLILQLLEAPWQNNKNATYVLEQVQACRPEIARLAARSDGGNNRSTAARASTLILEALEKR